MNKQKKKEKTRYDNKASVVVVVVVVVSTGKAGVSFDVLSNRELIAC